MNYNHYPNENGRQILNIGDKVMYFGNECEVVHKHKDGLINLKEGWHYIFGVHPNQVEKIKYEASKVKCDLCNNQWVAVRPANTEKLECPNCKNITNYE